MKIVAIIVGVLLMLAGAGCATGGSALAILVGGDGWIESDNGRIDTTTRALVSEVADIANEDPDGADFINDLDDFRLRFEADSTTDKDVFLGVGRAGEVTAYLAGVQHDVVNDIEFDDLAIDKTLVRGSSNPGRPGDQSFWVADVSGSGRQELDWKVRSGAYRFVLMNADGSPGVDVEAQFGLKIPYVMPVALALIVSGAIALILGLLIVVLAARSRRRPPPEPAPAAPAPTPAPPE